MAESRIASLNDAQAVRVWSTRLAADVARETYWRMMTGTEDSDVVQEKLELQSGPGDRVQFDLSMRLRGDVIQDDATADGNAESLDFAIDELVIGQARKPVSAGSLLSRKRTVHDLRQIARKRLKEFLAEWLDEVHFCYASGTAGNGAANEDALFRAAQFTGNPVEAPDAAHLMYGGTATAKANVAVTDTMTAALIRKICTRVTMLNARNPNVTAMKPATVGGKKAFILLMSPEQAHDLKNTAGTNEWLEIVKNAQVRGENNPLFTGAEGMIDGVLIHKHTGVRRFADYGPGSNIEAARGLFLGRQAMSIGWGQGSGSRMFWKEQTKDWGNQMEVLGGMSVGIKKTRFKPKGSTVGTDFGVVAVDTAAKAA